MACVETLDASDPPPDHVVIVDNGSEDDSIERLEAWADEHWIWRLAGTSAGPGPEGFLVRFSRAQAEEEVRARFVVGAWPVINNFLFL